MDDNARRREELLRTISTDELAAMAPVPEGELQRVLARAEADRDAAKAAESQHPALASTLRFR